jgi:molybdopterin-containing oxidoreductase family iron-sulfur binding subunit
LVLPDHHTLETTAELQPRRGIVALCQSAMRPIADTASTAEVTAKLGKLPVPPRSKDRAAWQRGGTYATVEPAAVVLRLDRLPPCALPEAQRDDLVLVPFPTALRHDGRSSASWLKETPDLLTGVSWTSWVELSPGAAGRLRVADGDVLALATSAGRAELPVCVRPGLRDDAVAIPLGGPEARALVPAVFDAHSGGLAWSGARVALSATGRRVELARADAGPMLSAGELLRQVSTKAPRLQREPEPVGMTPEPQHPVHRWAMAIDLDRCNGCQACMVACYAENNLPVLGPEAIAGGRSMAWLQIQRYQCHDGAGFELLPMLCQQCSSAPCETVCPVYATYHTPEGLNAQVYNRCVGTRYCANNCPYKVRAFNWRDPEFATPLDWQLNPDVTVRSKGVMEKCTFCVQRIRRGENAARDHKRPVADGDIVPACAQTCPARAITFGDANDPRSRVAALARDGRAFHVLAELNTRPAITYLARVRGDEQ